MGGGYFDKHTMMVVVVKLVLVSIFYLYNVVCKNTYFTYTKMGATLPVLKNEIEDFFFARLGTGRTYRCSLRHNVCHPATFGDSYVYNCNIYLV